MSDSAPEQLLGYLLGALEEPERASLEERLQSDAALRDRLARAGRMLAPLEASRRDADPPAGLAVRTCQFVATRARTAVDAAAEAPLLRSESGRLAAAGQTSTPPPEHAARHAMTAEVDPPAPAAGWRWADVAVAATVLAAAAAVIFPAILSSRFQARLTACQDNLRELGTALGHYSRVHDNYFPRVPARGSLAAAGIYAPTLISTGFLTEPRRVVCPASLLADDRDFEVPTLQKLQTAGRVELARMVPTLGGSYGYPLGYMEDGRYHDTRNLNRATFALMSDVPSPDRPDHQSDNHGGQGQNVLLEDGHVEFLTTPKPFDQADDFFVNDDGLVAAGSHRNDSVIGASAATPIVPRGW